jgi:peptidyl-prolyl cis-trans isomerase A (cyclophilin A)
MKMVFCLGVAALAGCGQGSGGNASAPLMDPGAATAQAPASFLVTFETTAGSFGVECHRDWAPNGADRFYNLVKIGFFDDVAFFRVVHRFVVQFGIHGNPDVAAKWLNANIPPDPPTQSNTRGKLTFAMAGSPDTRSTQLFINYGNNTNLDRMGFAPLCEVTGDGMLIVDKLYDGYGEGPTAEQDQIVSQGNKFLKEKHPRLDYIKTARIAESAPVAPDSASAAASVTPPSAPSVPTQSAVSAAPAASSSAAPSASAVASAHAVPAASSKK